MTGPRGRRGRQGACQKIVKAGGCGMRKTVVEHLCVHAAEEPDKPAVVTPGGCLSYQKLYRLVCGYAAYLKKAGLKKGEVVVVRAGQTLDYVVCYFGIHLVGGVVASTEKSVPIDRMLMIAKSVGASYIINGEPVKQDGTIWIDSGKVLEYAHDTEPTALEFPGEDDSADILFTTGTTGSSKGVELSHRALAATAENLIFGCGYSKETVIIVPGPLNHANAIRKLFTTIVNGSTIYILDGMVNITAFFDALTYPGKLACCLPPAAIRTIFALTGDEIQKYADRIDFIESATAPLPEPDKQKLGRLLPKTRLYNNYGSSEAASVCMYDYNAWPDKKGCIGKPMPNSKIIIVNDEKQEIRSSRENPGYLACVGDVNMKGYVNDPELTERVLQNGIVYTNDIGYIDEEGFVYIVGRKDDVINVGGLKVAPTEVEEAALSIEGIEDCICVPIPHPVTGQALKLLVVLQKGAEFSPAVLAAKMQKKLEGYKVPVRYEKVERVARTYNGKLDRKAYRM